MKKKIFLSIVLILVVLFTSFAYATENQDVMLINEDNMAVPTNEGDESTEGNAIPEEWRRTGESVAEPEVNVISQSYFMTNDNATLQDAVVDGNLFAVGTNISLNNVAIYGDVFIVGQNVTLSNVTVYGTGFVAGETTNMNSANFAGNIFNASQTMNFTGIAQDIFVVAETITINDGAMIAREIFASASKVNIEGGSVGKNAYISTDELTVGHTANISGTLEYSSENEANISSDSIIGNVNFNKEEQTVEESTTSSELNSKVYNVVTIAVKSIFVCGFIFLFAKGFMEKQKVSNVVAHLGKSSLKGFCWSIIIPIIGILLLFTGVSVGLSFTVFALYCIVFWASVPIVSVAITSNITTKQDYNAWRFFGYSIVISIVIAILKQIPTVGGIVTFIIGLAGMGIVMSVFKKKKDKNSNNIVEPENVVNE